LPKSIYYPAMSTLESMQHSRYRGEKGISSYRQNVLKSREMGEEKGKHQRLGAPEVN
jgi:hypothetical protein